MAVIFLLTLAYIVRHVRRLFSRDGSAKPGCRGCGGGCGSSSGSSRGQ
ncbi:MAG: FeoB-associated Cys-rich membrane protein [Magnetococcales bacterium]|nr:FeoB-associated Cys-rich membrane protein [Magnetococcales bacterium]